MCDPRGGTKHPHVNQPAHLPRPDLSPVVWSLLPAQPWGNRAADCPYFTLGLPGELCPHRKFTGEGPTCQTQCQQVISLYTHFSFQVKWFPFSIILSINVQGNVSTSMSTFIGYSLTKNHKKITGAQSTNIDQSYPLKSTSCTEVIVCLL